MKKTLSIILFVSFFTLSCTKYSDLNDSVYVSDPNYYGLPAYTEWGYNTFGANYDRDYFLYSDLETPLKVTVEDHEASFIFQGVKGNDYHNDNYMSVFFIIPDSTTYIYQDLMIYDEQKFDLTDSDITVKMTINGITNNVEVLEGHLTFNRVQKLYIDDVETQLIMSGFFDLKFINNDIPASLTNGRFDFGVDDKIFYYFP